MDTGFLRSAAAIGALLAIGATPAIARAQTGTFGISFGGNGAWLQRVGDLNQRMIDARRAPLFPLGGGIDATMEGSWRFIRLSGTFHASFFGEGDNTYRVMGGALMLGARLPWKGWVLLPSVGIAGLNHTLCVKNPPVGVARPEAPLFDQILSAPGPGECLFLEGPAGIAELGIDREFWASDTSFPRVGLFAGVRFSAAFAPRNAEPWTWDGRVISGPSMPFIAPWMSLVVGFRLGN